MSAFTRLYYANRGPDGIGSDASGHHPFEDAFHDPPVTIVPAGPDERAPSLWGSMRFGAELRLPRTDARYSARNPT
jgi:hypothetical protein